jgi:hypothetical protein
MKDSPQCPSRTLSHQDDMSPQESTWLYEPIPEDSIPSPTGATEAPGRWLLGPAYRIAFALAQRIVVGCQGPRTKDSAPNDDLPTMHSSQEGRHTVPGLGSARHGPTSLRSARREPAPDGTTGR